MQGLTGGPSAAGGARLAAWNCPTGILSLILTIRLKTFALHVSDDGAKLHGCRRDGNRQDNATQPGPGREKITHLTL